MQNYLDNYVSAKIEIAFIPQVPKSLIPQTQKYTINFSQVLIVSGELFWENDRIILLRHHLKTITENTKDY